MRDLTPSKGEPLGEHAAESFPSDNTTEKPLKLERTATFKDYLRIFSYGNTWDIAVYVTGMLAAVGTGVTMPLMFIFFGSFAGKFSNFVSENIDQDIDQFKDNLDRLCLYIFVLFLVRFALSTVHKFAFKMIGIRLSAAMRLQYLEHLFGQSIHVLDSLPPGHAVGTITATSNILQLGISEKLGILIEYASLIVAALIVALTWSWQLALVTISGFVLVVLVVGTLMPFIVKGQARQIESESKAASISSEAFASIRMIMACGAQHQVVDRYSAFIEEAKKHALATSPLTSFQFALTFFGVFGTIALTFWYGTVMFTKNKLNDVGVIVVVLMCLTTIFFSLDRISDPMQAIGKATLAACEFFSVIDAPLPETGRLKEPEVSGTKDILFNRVIFAYPSRPNVKILDELSLRIEAGKITAIVGPSGSGKSTIVGLIERWYTLANQPGIVKVTQQKKTKNGKEVNDDKDYDNDLSRAEFQESGKPVELQGAVTTCGHSLDDIDAKWWRAQIGLVQQEPFLFNDTIYENVVRGLIGSPWEGAPAEQKRELVKRACEEAFADEFVDKLPQGYDTKVGDGGARLSGGQRQRIAIARSIIKKPSILILDEATSAIDVRGERIVQAALDRAAEGRTTITIAHRLSTIKNADRIVVLKKGKVVESGTHESLMSVKSGVYAGLVNAQALSSETSEQEHDENTIEAEDIATLIHEKTQAELEKLEHSDKVDETRDCKSRGFFGSFGRFFYESKQCWGIIAFSLMASVIASTAQPLHAWLFSRAIGLFRYQNDHDQLMHEVDFQAEMWTVFAVSAGIAYFLTFISSGGVASFIRARYQTEYFESLIFQRAAYFDMDDHSQGTLSSRVRDDPRKLEEMMGMNIAQVCIAIGNIIGGIVIALIYSWKLALVSIAAAIPICIFSGYIRFRYELLFEKMNDEVFADSSHLASEAIGAFRTVTSMTLENSILEGFQKLCHSHVRAAYKKARWVSFILGFSDSATLAYQALIFYYGSGLFIRGEIDIIAFFVCIMGMMNAAEAFGKSLSFGPNAAQATAASNRILDARGSRLGEQHVDDDIIDTNGGIEIELRDVCFRYPVRETPVLNGFNMKIEKGQFVALVGASGSGKTSIISLLERFYEPERGQILFNGKDISKIDIETYRKHLSWVSQEPILFLGTIRDNIILGLDPATITDNQIEAACRDASIHEFVASLPEGYNTIIGSRGVALSGGQKQRISIARALLRNPKVLLLDEATSSLDSESERLVQAAFEGAAKGRTVIAVAHRLATIQNADVIFVMGDEGRLLEQGTHLQLLKKRGVYYQLCQNQALDK